MIDFLDDVGSWLSGVWNDVGSWVNSIFSGTSVSDGYGGGPSASDFKWQEEPTSASSIATDTSAADKYGFNVKSSGVIPRSSDMQGAGDKGDNNPPPGKESPKSIDQFLKDNGALIFLTSGLATLGGSYMTANAATKAAERKAQTDEAALALKQQEQAFSQANGSAMPRLSLTAPTIDQRANVFNQSQPTYRGPRVASGLLGAN